MSNETPYAGKRKLVGWNRTFRNLIAASLGLYVASAPPWALAGGTSYETQIAGFIYSSVRNFIVGEFAGRSAANIVAKMRMPVCKASDYDDLRAAANDRAAFEEFHRRCRFVEFRVESRQLHGTAYLPKAYCQVIKQAFDTMLAEQIYDESSNKHGDVVSFEYKGARYMASRRALARRAQLRTTCAEDGSLRVSASR